jgi:predicted acyltransferase
MPRLTSVDAFRGLAIVAMLIVSNPGDPDQVYRPLARAEWDEWALSDLIFPFFLFIVGVSITLSHRVTWLPVVRRGVLIIALGLFLTGYPRFDLATWRIPGVLQRIGVCYLAAAGLYHATSGDRRRRGAILMSVAVFITIAYWLVNVHVPVPGGTAADLTPERSLGAYIDRTLMPGHLANAQWDPDGLFGTVPSIASTLFGVVAGLCLASDQNGARKAAQIGAAGAGAIVGGALWNVILPIDRNLWSSSYAVFSAGAAALVLASIYWAVEVRGWRGWTRPFAVFGSNPVTMYVASVLLASTLGAILVTGSEGTPTPFGRHVYVQYFEPLASAPNASLLYACTHLVVLFMLAVWMHRRRLFLRL